MSPEIVIALLLAVLVGVSLGMLGGGGSILTVPILTYVLGMPPQQAIAASLFIVGVTSAVGTVMQGRAGRVRLKIGLIFGAAGMVGAFAGGIVGGYIPGTVLMLLFAVMMVATATAMIRGRRKKVPETGGNSTGALEPGSSSGKESGGSTELPLIRVILDGFLVGIATGLVGAGGGFLVVPALNLLGGLPMAIAIGTSLLVITLKSFAGLAGYLLSVQIQWPIVLTFTAIAIAGSFIGTKVSGKISEKALRKGFGFFVLAMGAFVLIQELPQSIALFTET